MLVRLVLAARLDVMARRRSLGQSFTVLGVVAVGLVWSGAPAQAETDPFASRQWGIALIGAPAAWARSTGRGVTVAVVDTGIDLHHEDLPGDRIVVVPGANFITAGAPPQDDQGHGTHVAGIIGAATGNGVGVQSVAPDATLMPVKVLDASGGSQGTSVEDGIRFAADHGAQVINVSIGVQLIQPVTGPGFQSAIEYAWSKGAVAVVAAGNNYNGSLLGSGYSPDTHALVVAATDRNDNRATYSSGSNGARWAIAAPGGADPNFSPPEDTVFSTIWRAGQTNQYGYEAGTSMAAPQVTGVVADLLALGLTPQQAIDRLLATARKGLDPALGAGRVDVAAAVAVAGLGSTSAGPAVSAQPSTDDLTPAPPPQAGPGPANTTGPSATDPATTTTTTTPTTATPPTATDNAAAQITPTVTRSEPPATPSPARGIAAASAAILIASVLIAALRHKALALGQSIPKPSQ